MLMGSNRSGRPNHLVGAGFEKAVMECNLVTGNVEEILHPGL